MVLVVVVFESVFVMVWVQCRFSGCEIESVFSCFWCGSATSLEFATWFLLSTDVSVFVKVLEDNDECVALALVDSVMVCALRFLFLLFFCFPCSAFFSAVHSFCSSVQRLFHALLAAVISLSCIAVIVFCQLQSLCLLNLPCV